MSAAMKLIVGLGNPGREYTRTRHNVGFQVLDRLAERWGLSWSAKFAGLFTRGERMSPGPVPPPRASPGSVGAQPVSAEPIVVGLLEPMTYMNLSGRSVSEAANFFKIAPTDVLVVADDIHLDIGVLRVRENGSAGGHNGLKDIIRALGGPDFPRLRVGVGPFAGGDSAEFVLGNFHSDEWEKLLPELDRAADAAEVWLLHGTATAANQFNARATSEAPKPKKKPLQTTTLKSTTNASPTPTTAGAVEDLGNRSNPPVPHNRENSQAEPPGKTSHTGGVCP